MLVVSEVPTHLLQKYNIRDGYDVLLEEYPELLKEIEIEQNDERNIEIMNKAKAKAYVEDKLACQCELMFAIG